MQNEEELMTGIHTDPVGPKGPKVKKGSKKDINATKSIKVFMKNNDVTQARVIFSGGTLNPEQFTNLFMSVLDTYTVGLLETNTPEDVFKHFNHVFGVFLSRVVPNAKKFQLSDEHAKFKKNLEHVLKLDEEMTSEEREQTQAKTEENRLAAYILCREVLVTDVGMTPESADLLLNKKLGLIELNSPEVS